VSAPERGFRKRHYRRAEAFRNCSETSQSFENSHDVSFAQAYCRRDYFYDKMYRKLLSVRHFVPSLRLGLGVGQ
jgi:hypothetical protein